VSWFAGRSPPGTAESQSPAGKMHGSLFAS
jgi:hypothetical protein